MGFLKESFYIEFRKPHFIENEHWLSLKGFAGNLISCLWLKGTFYKLAFVFIHLIFRKGGFANLGYGVSVCQSVRDNVRQPPGHPDALASESEMPALYIGWGEKSGASFLPIRTTSNVVSVVCGAPGLVRSTYMNHFNLRSHRGRGASFISPLTDDEAQNYITTQSQSHEAQSQGYIQTV